jgi:hypothetical protein
MLLGRSLPSVELSDLVRSELPGIKEWNHKENFNGKKTEFGDESLGNGGSDSSGTAYGELRPHKQLFAEAL